MPKLIFWLCLVAAPIAGPAQAKDQPNIVLCMTDDQGWGDTGYNGHPHLKTPALDKMSREGVTFTRFYSEHPEYAQHYYACVTAMDEQVGRLRTELDDLGAAGNTMLWFCSDNGPARQGSPRHVGPTGGLSGFKLSLNELDQWKTGVLKELAEVE